MRFLFSGNANNGSNAGCSYSNSNNAPSNANANIGSQLCLFLAPKTLPTWQKINNSKAVLVANSERSIYNSKQMKRLSGLYEKIYSLDNLYLADEIARKGKSKSYGVMRHDKRKDENILNLHNSLKNKTFRTSKYDIFKIYEPKERDIYRLPYYPDRIVHHAVMNVLEPIWVSIFTKDTYACIKGRGVHAAVKPLKTALKDKEATRYCLKIDIKKFYPSIDHTILKSIIRRKIKDKDLLWLLDGIIDSAEGVPIGNYLSQYFANLYLAYFDHYVKEMLKIKYYWRYADDIVILSDSKARLHDTLAEIRAYMQNELKLEIKGNYQIFPVDARGIDFLGYRFYHTHTLLRKRIKKKLCKKASKNQSMKAISSWLGWCYHCDSRNLLRTLTKHKNYEIKFKHCA